MERNPSSCQVEFGYGLHHFQQLCYDGKIESSVKIHQDEVSLLLGNQFTTIWPILGYESVYFVLFNILFVGSIVERRCTIAAMIHCMGGGDPRSLYEHALHPHDEMFKDALCG